VYFNSIITPHCLAIPVVETVGLELYLDSFEEFEETVVLLPY